MTEVLSALAPVVVVGGAVVYAIVKLLRSEGAGLRSARHPDDNDNTTPRG